MKSGIILLCASVALTAVGCGNEGPVASSPDQETGRIALSKPAQRIPVTYTMTLTESFPVEPNNGGRFRGWTNRFEIAGDFVGTCTVVINFHWTKGNGPEQAPYGQTQMDLTLDVAHPGLGLNGGFEGIISGKIRGPYMDVGGLLVDRNVAHGTGDFEGMLLKAIGTIPWLVPEGEPAIITVNGTILIP